MNTRGGDLNAAELLDRCRPMHDRFVASAPDAAWRVGVIAHVTSDAGTLALVRKAAGQRPGYEFEERWALPGGMIRSEREAVSDANRAALDTLTSRASKEAGLDLMVFRDDDFTDRLGPLVSSYSTATGRRHTLILVRQYSGPERPLAPGDDSIDLAAWSDVPPEWSTLAPAALLAVAHLAWHGLGERERHEAAPYVEAAASTCSAWAREVDLPAVPLPWDERAVAVWPDLFP